MRSKPALLPLVLMLAACGQNPASAPEDGAAAPIAAPAPSEPTAAGPAPIDLGVLSSNDAARGELRGELGCGFMPALGQEELWVGAGDVDPQAGAQGLIKVDGKPVKLSMDGTGGYDAMADGARFTSGDLAVAFVRTGGEPLQEEPGIEMESAAFPARMTVTRGGQTLAIEGVLECGP